MEDVLLRNGRPCLASRSAAARSAPHRPSRQPACCASVCSSSRREASAVLGPSTSVPAALERTTATHTCHGSSKAGRRRGQLHRCSAAEVAGAEAAGGGASTSGSEAAGAGAASSSSSSGSRAGSVAPDDIVAPKREARLTLEQYKEIYDRLIAIFQTRPRDDWKKLIVFSKQWDQHAQGVFDRIKELADGEGDVDKKMALRKLFRALQNVNEEVSRYNRILLKLAEAGDDEWEAIVAAYRGDLQRPFFEHVQCLLAAAKDDAARLDQLVLLNTRLVALIANHDAVAAEPEKLEAAAELYRDLLTSISSIEDLDKRMADLAASGKIDPAFLQISAKAYGAARDTNMTKDEAKWVAYKLYRQARDYFDRQQPAEKRIIEYLLTIPDPSERTNLLDKAVTPGPVRATETHDYMYSTPQRLFLVLDNTLRAYHLMRDGAAKNLNTPEAAVLPRKVRVMMELRDEIIRRYL